MNADEGTQKQVLDCPSSQPSMSGASVFGVMSSIDGEERVSYLERRVPVTRELLLRTAPLDPTSVLRVAAPCATHACPHFEGNKCTLSAKIVNLLPAAVDGLAPCPIRKSCRWFAEHGKDICLRCAGITTALEHPPENLMFVVNPKTRSGDPAGTGV